MIVRLLVGVLACAPVGVGVGLWLAAGVGVGVAAGSALYGALAVGALFADVLPDPQPEVTR